MKGSLIVVGFFALGLLAGRSGCMPTWLMEGDISMVALCALLLFVGIGIGLNPDMKNELKSLSPRLLSSHSSPFSDHGWERRWLTCSSEVASAPSCNIGN